jgi:CRISPR-associated endonuclease/helicase Cas3
MDKEIRTFLAHFRINDEMVQTVEEHLEGVKNKCGCYAAEVGFGYTGKLIGLLHDIGKFTDEFYDYITEAFRREKEELPTLKSNIDHGKYGAMLVLEHYHDGDIFRRMMSEIIAMTVCYHHGGMEDYISEDLNIKLFNRCGLSDKGKSPMMRIRIMIRPAIDFLQE